MKKLFAAFVLVALLAFAAPAVAATNPFMDVPLHHWAYDAVAQLSAQGIVSGFPDGTYRGGQPVTRYEMASLIARSIGHMSNMVDRQEMEMMKRLVLEFSDELRALGVVVEDLVGRVSVMESRQGGWRFSGQMRMDAGYRMNVEGGEDNHAFVNLHRARLFIDRDFGPNESMRFHMRLENSEGPFVNNSVALNATRYWIEFPFYNEWRVLVGRQYVDTLEVPYTLDAANNFSGAQGHSEFMYVGGDVWMTGRAVAMMALRRSFGMGFAHFHIARPNLDAPTEWRDVVDPPDTPYRELNVLELHGFSQLENFAFDLGFQAFLGDDTTNSFSTPNVSGTRVFDLNNLYTLMAGLRFNFFDGLALRGMYYYQNQDLQEWYLPTQDIDESPSAFRAILAVDQALLQFTSLWIEYSMLDQHFFLAAGGHAATHLFFDPEGAARTSEARSIVAPGNRLSQDLTIIRAAARQQWNDDWATFLYYANYALDVSDNIDQFGFGVTYRFSPQVAFGLGWSRFSYGTDGINDEDTIRFRTQVNF